MRVIVENGVFCDVYLAASLNVWQHRTMEDMAEIEQLKPAARNAWKRLKDEFPLWVTHLGICNEELEFAVPAPSGSAAGHLVAFTNGNDLWIRFSPPYMCYSADSLNEMVWLIHQLTADKIMFKVTMKGAEWVETTLTNPQEKCEAIPGHSVHLVSWSGRYDKLLEA